ncbi:hypothetical protein NOV72_01233 [Caballeronia novacaledonica]|uniref:Uncharacterized protein n=1 Tax=Caballeronia novacaledonica TaxID=1544861 RepID=A0A2U3I1J2_9BURK|nr:hypothetical protein NOV72_01233 [Caballeronia novacaledonica]
MVTSILVHRNIACCDEPTHPIDASYGCIIDRMNWS